MATITGYSALTTKQLPGYPFPAVLTPPGQCPQLANLTTEASDQSDITLLAYIMSQSDDQLHRAMPDRQD